MKESMKISLRVSFSFVPFRWENQIRPCCEILNTLVDATRLDQWVFDQVNELFESAKSDPALDAALRENQVVFFLHLLGLDTHGHSHRPHSSEYLGNIASVDSGIQQIVAMMNEFYHHDEKTAFVFTADHGMNDRGAHGDGDPQNTETPFLAWGAGIAKPEKVIDLGDKQGDVRTTSWNLQHLLRKDVFQADIAPLMATLLGTRFPKNSAGVLPLEYLAGTIEFKTRSLFANAQQILAQYLTKEDKSARCKLRFSRSFFFTFYPPHR